MAHCYLLSIIYYLLSFLYSPSQFLSLHHMLDVKTIIWFLLTLMLMGFFAGIEMAFYSANRLNIELKKKQRTGSGKLLSQFIESPVKFLGTTLIGFNLFLAFFALQVGNVMKPL